MNETVKDILADKLGSAKRKEGLDNYEVAQILGLKSLHYVGKMISKTPAQREKVPREAWKATQGWTNSGLSLRQYGEKTQKIVKTASELVGNLADELPEIPEPTKEEMEFIEGALLTQDQVRPIQENKPPKSLKDLAEHHKSRSTRIQDIPLDRLKVIFDALKELRDMGYGVDVKIYENG